MKNRITQVINKCETCQTLKYDRHPPKIVFQKTETPMKPLDIVHTDLYTINNRLAKQRRTDNLNKEREEPLYLQEGDIVYRKKNRRNKIIPRFTTHEIEQYMGVTCRTKRKQKIYKEKNSEIIIHVLINYRTFRPTDRLFTFED